MDANPYLGELLGYHCEHFLGKQLWQIGLPQDAESSKEAMATLQRVGQVRYEDHPLQHKDGRHISVEFVNNVYREGSRDVIQCNIRDITERKRLAEELAKAKEVHYTSIRGVLIGLDIFYYAFVVRHSKQH